MNVLKIISTHSLYILIIFFISQLIVWLAGPIVNTIVNTYRHHDCVKNFNIFITYLLSCYCEHRIRFTEIYATTIGISIYLIIKRKHALSINLITGYHNGSLRK